jgi:hypothetical protein
MMTRTPSFDELLATGETLRGHLADAGSSVEAIAAVVNEIRAWQRRCAWVVVARAPRAVADFRADSGSFQRPMDAGHPPLDYQWRLADALSSWLTALERVNRRPSRSKQPGRGFVHQARVGLRS